MTTVVLADDHAVVRVGMVALLRAEPDLRLVGEAIDGLEAVDLVQRLKPDVLVLDLMMPGLNGLEVMRRIGPQALETRVIMLSSYDREDYVLEALRSGASGYVLKDSCVKDLVRAVREVAAGRRYLSRSLSQRAIDAYVQKAATAAPDAYETLTDREREVLHLTRRGSFQCRRRGAVVPQFAHGGGPPGQSDAQARTADSDGPDPLRPPAGDPSDGLKGKGAS